MRLDVSSSPDRPPSNALTLSAHLWDLRSQAEAKLRCLTRLQQSLVDYEGTVSKEVRLKKREAIVNDLTDIVTISKTLRSVADEAFTAAEALD